MPLGPEILRSIRGAFRIALLDPDAPAWFNLSIEGFWRSFLAPALLAPVYFAIILHDVGQTAGDAEPAPLAAPRMLAFALSCVAFPLVMIPIARLLQLSASYVSYIIMWNWSGAPQAVVVVPAMASVGVLSERASNLLFMVATISVLFYGYLVARAGLRCPAITALGVVALDLVVSLLISAGSRALLA